MFPQHSLLRPLLANHSERVHRSEPTADSSANFSTEVIRSDDPSIETYGDLTTRDVGEYGQSIFVTSSAPANEQDCGISFNFTGSSIAIYAPPQGDIPLQRTFDVYFNSSAEPQHFDTKAYSQIYSNMPLQFQANGLPEGMHRLVMRCLRGGDGNRSLGFDHAVAVVPERYLGNSLCFVNCTCEWRFPRLDHLNHLNQRTT